MKGRKSQDLEKSLVQLCSDCQWHPDAEILRDYVDGGVDIFFPAEGSRVFHKLLSLGQIDCIKVCLDTARTLNFSVKDNPVGRNPLFLACECACSDLVARDMVKHIVLRSELHPKDIIDWGGVDDRGWDFVNCAAYYQRLALFLPLVNNVPFFADRMEPYPLSLVWEWDWNALKDEHKRFFRVPHTTINCAQSTATLFTLANTKNLTNVPECVREGADLLFTHPALPGGTILHKLSRQRDTACLKACLATSQRLDFNVRDQNDRPLFHEVILSGVTERELRDRIHMLLNRLESHPSDALDWGVTRRGNKDLLYLLRETGKHAFVLPILQSRNVKYFLQEHTTAKNASSRSRKGKRK